MEVDGGLQGLVMFVLVTIVPPGAKIYLWGSPTALVLARPGLVSGLVVLMRVLMGLYVPSLGLPCFNRYSTREGTEIPSLMPITIND